MLFACNTHKAPRSHYKLHATRCSMQPLCRCAPLQGSAACFKRKKNSMFIWLWKNILCWPYKHQQPDKMRGIFHYSHTNHSSRDEWWDECRSAANPKRLHRLQKESPIFNLRIINNSTVKMNVILWKANDDRDKLVSHKISWLLGNEVQNNSQCSQLNNAHLCNGCWTDWLRQ